MSHINCKYLGDLKVECIHNASGVKLLTDAPLDNHGQGSSFSPTDLCVTSLAACAMTIIGITANTHGFDVTGTEIEVLKIMTSKPPRKIGRIEMIFHMPPREYSTKEKQMIERAARTCPVHLSLDPGIEQLFIFEWA